MLKRSVNELLRQVTGLELRRADPAAGRDAVRRPSGPGAAPAGARRGGGRQRAHRRRRGASRPALPRHFDPIAARIVRQVQSRTMTDQAKLFGLIEATRYVAREGIPGDVVECGVWRGGSMQAVALTLLDLETADRGLHLFDTFEGMPPPTDKDRRRGATAEELLAQHDRDHRMWAVAGLEDVQQGMRETAYPQHLIHYHQGLVEDTIPAAAPDRIAILRLDTDWYESTRHELQHLYHRLSPGGLLIIDDYGDWEGARLAVDEFVGALPQPMFLAPLGTGRLAIKPLR